MFLRFDHREHEFAAPNYVSAPEATDLSALIASASGRNHEYTPPRGGRRFNDLHQYLNLSNFGKTEIRRIKVYHSDGYCMGVEVMYVNTNGSASTKHVSNYGYYAFNGGGMRATELFFADDEYLCEVRTRQGDITDQITVCTNKRTVSFGGMGGEADPRSVSNTPVDLTKRVVAFVGAFDGVLSRLGTVSILHNWHIIREFVLIRALVERGRARTKRKRNEEAMLQELIRVEDVNVFRRILSFLIENIIVDTNNYA